MTVVKTSRCQTTKLQSQPRPLIDKDKSLVLLRSDLFSLLDRGGVSRRLPTAYTIKKVSAIRQCLTIRQLRLTEHASTRFEWSLQVTLCRSVEDVDSNGLSLDQVLETHKTLNEEGLRVLHVSVEERHHEHAHVYTANKLGGLCQVIIPNCRRHKSS